MQDDRLFVKSYGNGGFSIAENGFSQGNIILAQSHNISFTKPFTANDINLNSLAFLKDYKNKFDYLVVGCGEGFVNPSFEIKKFIKENNFLLEFVNTRCACHAFNDLVLQGDSVLAVMLAVD